MKALVKIDKHISDLLQDNECVIVPKMGGFLSSHSPAGNHSIKYSSKSLLTKLSFSELLKYNDGLLANHIANHEKLTYSEALIEIEKFVNKFHQELDSGKKFIIDQVGVLYKDARLNVQIEPFENLNHLNDTEEISGIPPLSVLQIEFKRDEKEQPEIPVTSKQNQQKIISSKRNRVIIFASLLMVSLLAFCLYIYFSPSSKENSESLNSNSHRITEQPVDYNASKSVTLVPHSDSISGIIDRSFTNTVTEKRAVKPNYSVETEYNAKNKTAYKYFIVAGSFKSFDNANRKLDALKLQGFKNAQIFSDSRNLQLVCYDSFNTLKAAHEKMNSIRMQYNEAWIYSR